MATKTSVSGNRVTIDDSDYNIIAAGANRYAVNDEFGGRLGYFTVRGKTLDADDYGSDRDWLLKTKAAADANSRTLFDEIVEGITTVSTRAPDPNWTVDLILS